MLELADCELVVSLAEHGSLGRAAASLGYVQSRVSSRLAQLERGLGEPLFERHSRGVRPTRAGLTLLPYAQRLLALREEAARAVRAADRPAGPLAIGAMETTAARRLPPLLRAFTAACPAVRLALTTGTSEALVAEVLAGRLDGAFVAGPVQHPGLTAVPAFAERLALATPVGVDPAAPGLAALVFRPGCAYRRHFEGWLVAEGLGHLPRMELGSLDGILGCVAAGMGIALLPAAVLEAPAAAGQVAVRPLPAARAVVTTVFVQRAEAPRDAAREAFVASLGAAAAHPPPP